MVTNLDGGDLETTLKKHRFRKRWLAQAEQWLQSDRDAVSLSNYDIRHDNVECAFYFDIPRSMWEPQLRAQVEQCRKDVAEMDRIAREYMEAALKC